MANSLLSCLTNGEKLYADYKKTRLKDRSKGLFDTIHKTSGYSKKKSKKKKDDVDFAKIKDKFTKCIEVGRIRDYVMKKLFSFDLTDMPYFLLSKDGNYLTGNIKKAELQSLSRDNSPF